VSSPTGATGATGSTGTTALPPLRPLLMKDRMSFLALERGRLDVLDGAFVLVDKHGVRTCIPVGSVAALLLEPGIRVSHAAVALAATVGCLLIWVGEAGVRLYASGQPGGARSDRLLYQARLALDEDLKLKVVRKMFALRFGEAPQRRSVDQLRGIEGARVREMYKLLAQRHGVAWDGRSYDQQNWGSASVVNRCLSVATHCLYGITEAAVLAAGYAPAIGFLHTGKPLSFVYDMADIVKFETVVPVAFQVARQPSRTEPVERTVRRACRDSFRQQKTLERMIPLIEEVLAAGEITPPAPPDDAQPPALPEPARFGEEGHRG
jgi:CRISP-associated protein Cas1